MEEGIVWEFSEPVFLELLSSFSKADKTKIQSKQQFNYLFGYLEDIGVNTIVVEKEYIDKDYLEDFAAYYVRCFQPYARFCTRFHFFSSKFNDSDFNEFLQTGKIDTNNPAPLQKNSDNKQSIKNKNPYLGFIVVKPLPLTIFGRTCLNTYQNDGHRNYLAVRDYQVNLFGIQLVIKDTLAFQEQDSVVAACATSALWSAFNLTGDKFQHQIPSPSKITKSAIDRRHTRTRIMPNKGLTVEEMANAILSVGLEPQFFGATDPEINKACIYAYCKFGLPILLGIELLEICTEPASNGKESNKRTINLMSYHAVTITGFSSGRLNEQIGDTIKLTSSRIDKLYCHDDGLGPFARMEFSPYYCDNEGQLMTPPEKNTQQLLTTSWFFKNSSEGDIFAAPFCFLVPLYHKIRIPFDCVLNKVKWFRKYLCSIYKPFTYTIDNIEWDIHLTNVKELRMSIRNANTLSSKERLKLLKTPSPKYLWRVGANNSQDGKSIFELFFDATEVAQGLKVHVGITHGEEICKHLREVPVLPEWQKSPAWEIIKWFQENKSFGQ